MHLYERKEFHMPQRLHVDHKDNVLLLMPCFLDDYFVTYPNYVTGGPVSDTPLGRVPGLPTTFLVSPAGTVEARQVGGVTREMIENFIRKWEAKQSKK